MSRGFIHVEVRRDRHGWPFVGFSFANIPMDMLQRHHGASAAIQPREAWAIGWQLVRAAVAAWYVRTVLRARARLQFRKKAANDSK